MLELCIRNGSVLDGRGVPEMRADIGILDGRIVAFGDLDRIPSARDIDAAGKIVCPGFIDAHSHGDMSIGFYPATITKVCQGVTTEIAGMCGDGCFPIDKRFLGEYNTWDGIRKERKKLWLQKGLTGVEYGS